MVKMNGLEIELVSKMKYLGVVFDPKQSWNQHIEYVCAKTEKIVQRILRTTGNGWGLSGKVFRILYNGAIEPLLCYACPAWIGGLNETNKAKLLSTQRSFALMITRGYRTISLEASLVLANIPPIDLRLKLWSNRYLIRHNIVPETLPQLTYQQPAHFLEDGHPALRANYVRQNCLKSHHFNIFTDGSKKENESTNRKQTGCAFVVKQQETIYHSEKARLHDECSVFQSELLAIKNAVTWCLQQDKTAIINSDSQSALQAISNKKNRNKLAVEIRKLLRQHPKHICLCWVKAHVGIEGNEEADRLAKEATNLETSSYNELPPSCAVRIWKQQETTAWDERYRTSTDGRETIPFFPTVLHRKKCSNIPDFITTQFMSGHGKFHYYLTRFNIEHDKRCEFCVEPEQTSLHLIKECPRWALLRNDLDSHICRITNSNQLILPSVYCTDRFYRHFRNFVYKIYNDL